VNLRSSVIGWAAAGAVGWGLAGCASAPASALPSVQDQVTSRAGLTVGWPKTSAERSARGDAVRVLLARDLTPETAVEIALLNSPELQATFEDLGISEADLFASGRMHNPTFFASTRWPDSHPRGPDAEFSLTADLLDDFLIPVRQRVARSQVAAAENRVARAAIDLAAEVKVAAYTLAGQQMFRSRLQAIADANGAAAELAQRQFDAGNISRLDLARDQTAAQEAQLQLMRAEAQIQADRETLNRLLGLTSAQAEWKFAGELAPLPAPDFIPADLESRALAQRLDLSAAQSDLTVAQSGYELRRKTRLSPASVNVGVDTERNPDGSRVTGPQLTIGLPIFDQGQADLARLSAEVRRSQDRVDGLKSAIAAEVRSARAALQSARAAADYYARTILPQRELILRETLLNYNAMQKSSYELLFAKEEQLRAEREGIEALRDYWIARVELEKAAGGKLEAP